MRSRLSQVVIVLVLAATFVALNPGIASAEDLDPVEKSKVLSVHKTEGTVLAVPSWTPKGRLGAPLAGGETRSWRSILVEMVSYTRAESESASSMNEDSIKAWVTGLYMDGGFVDSCFSLGTGSNFIKCDTGNEDNPAGSQFWANSTKHFWHTDGYVDNTEFGSVTGNW